MDYNPISLADIFVALAVENAVKHGLPVEQPEHRPVLVECPQCGVAVSNQERHTQWHNEVQAMLIF